MAELLPCPFCGGEAMVWHWYIKKDILRWQCDCRTCGAGTAQQYTEDEAIEAWNARAADGVKVVEQ